MKKTMAKRGLALLAAGAVAISSYSPVMAYRYNPGEIMDMMAIKDTFGKAGMTYARVNYDRDEEIEIVEARASGRYLNVKVFDYKESKNTGVKVAGFSKVSKMWEKENSGTFVVATAGKPTDTYTEYRIKGNGVKVVVRYSSKKKKGKTLYFKNKKQVKKAVFNRYVRSVKKKADPSVFSVAGYPWIDSNVVGYAGVVGDPGPENDAHLSFNYNALIDTGDPEDRNDRGPENDFDEGTTTRKEDILTGRAGSGFEAGAIRTVFAKETDFAGRAALGLEPVIADIADIEKITSIEEMTAYLTDVSKNVPSRFIDIQSAVNSHISGVRICAVEDDDIFGEYILYDHYDKTLKEVFERLGYSRTKQDRIIRNADMVSSTLAEGRLSQYECWVQYPGDEKAYVRPDEVAVISGDFPLAEILEAYGSKAQTLGFATAHRALFDNLAKLYKKKNLQAMKDYLVYVAAVRAIVSTDPKLLIDMYNENRAYFEREPVEMPQTQKEIEEFMADLMTNQSTMVGGGLEKHSNTLLVNAYVKEYYTSEQKEKLEAFIRSVIENYEAMLREEDWIFDETKAKAIEKLKGMRIHSIFPDTLSDLSYFTVDKESSLYESLYDVRDDCWRHFLAAEGEARDMDGWRWDLDTVLDTTTYNAFYDPASNGMYMCGGFVEGIEGILDKPVEELYAYMGLVTGHEISHAFDSMGAEFDKDGNYVVTAEDPSGWWAEEDWERFRQKVSKVEKYYDGITPLNGAVMEGRLLTGEAIADMGAQAVILRMAEQNPGFDYDRYFRAYAAGLFLSKTNAVTERYLLSVDVHPLGFLRTNVTLQQFDEFYETYGVKEGDGMYLAPEERIKIW